MAAPEKKADTKPAPSANSTDENPDTATAKPKKNKKIMIIAATTVALGVAGGGWYFTQSSPHDPADSKPKPRFVAPSGPPKFLVLEPFTVNLQREAADQFLQVGITLKIVDDAQLGEQLNLMMPEIRSHLLILLSGKYPSELATIDGKKKLVQEIIGEINTVLGFKSSEPIEQPPATASPKAEETAPEDAETVVTEEDDAAAQEDTEPAPEDIEPGEAKASGILDVLFTAFIIQ